MQIILGSQSPRRRELMAGLDIPFTAITIDAEESFPSDLVKGDIPLYISRAKAKAYESQLEEDQLLITADTIVWCDNHMLGKPKDLDDACAMLRQLRDNTHQVYTAVTLAQKGHQLESFVDCTDVTFGHLTDEEIENYVKSYKPLDKAGSYGVQEWVGYVGCTSLKGSYFNVMGFPIHLVYQALKKRGVI